MSNPPLFLTIQSSLNKSTHCPLPSNTGIGLMQPLLTASSKNAERTWSNRHLILIQYSLSKSSITLSPFT
uniref:Uncharacterized protein MANES_01G060100 n=1 Tax=Rhizophora mucronata TaxID=61149 RepID=A0A2P2MZR7_RHIMU